MPKSLRILHSETPLMWRGVIYEKPVNQRTSGGYDVNIVHNCCQIFVERRTRLSGHSAFIAQTRLNHTIGWNYTEVNSSFIKPAVVAAERPIFLASEIWSLIILCKGQTTNTGFFFSCWSLQAIILLFWTRAAWSQLDNITMPTY